MSEREPSIGIVTVSFGHEAEVARLINSIGDQLKVDDKVVVVDNKPPHTFGCHKLSKNKYKPQIVKHNNGGFAAGCNAGVAKIIEDVDIIFLLNPDTYTNDPVMLDKLRKIYDRKYAAWMPLLLLPDGKVNSAGNVIHMTGLSWVDGYLQAPDKYEEQGVVGVRALSGACLAIRSKWWKRINGLNENYFMYVEDTDMCTRIIMQGGEMGLVPSAQIMHDYEFNKGDYKWQYLERNRLLYVLQCWPLSIIILNTPFLIFFEILISLVYILRGWGLLKLKASLSLLSNINKIRSVRRYNQKVRVITPLEFWHNISYKLDSPIFGLLSGSRVVNTLMLIHYRFINITLRLFFRQHNR